jgi:transposase-like protein
LISRRRVLDRSRACTSGLFIDAIVVRICDSQVTNRPAYAAVGVTLEGEREVLG